MEQLSKFVQIGPSHAVFTQIRFIQPNADWMSVERFQAAEAELSSVIEKRLPDILSLKPGAMESVNGDLTYGDIKVTYNMKKRPNMCSFVLRPCANNNKWDAKRAKLEESTSKFRDYGGMFQRKTVLKSELTVSMRRLTASELAQQTKVHNTQASESSSRGISGYFKPAVVPRPKTPEEKAALKRLLDRRETKKRRISSSDSESNSASENLCEAFKPSKHHNRRLTPSAHSEKLKDSKAEENIKKFASLSQPVPEKHASQAAARPDARISATQSCKPAGSSRGSSPSVQVGWNRQDRPDPPKESSKAKPSSHRDKDKAKSHDLGSSSRSSSSSSSRHKEHKTRSEHKESRERDTSHSHKTEMDKESSSKPSRSGKEKEMAQEGSRHRDKRHSPPRKLRKEEKSSSSKRTHESRDREDKPKASKPKVANIKQLLTDCGISDSDDSDKGRSEKNQRDETPRRSPDSTQLVDVRPTSHTSKSDGAAKRESLDDFQSKKEMSRAVSMASKRQKEPDVLCKSLFLDDEESNDDEDKGGQEGSKSPTTEDCVPAVNVLKRAPSRLPETDVYEPTPVAKLATEDDAEERPSSKPAVLSAGLDEEVSKLMSTPPHRDSYVPSYRQTPTKTEAFSYDPASPKRQDDKRKRKDAGHVYIPSSIGPSSAARPSRGRYEEYVPEAVNRTARHQQSTVDYVPTYIPTPKREINTDVSTTTYSMQQHDDRSAAPEGSLSGTASIVEQEIRNARCVRDLEDKHIRYLFGKTLPVLVGISKKQVESWRFEAFRKGGPAKRALTHKVYIHKFSEHQVDLMLNLFTEEFARRRRTDGDFIHQVLIPEFLTRVYMLNRGTTYEESEKLMAQSGQD